MSCHVDTFQNPDWYCLIELVSEGGGSRHPASLALALAVNWLAA